MDKVAIITAQLSGMNISDMLVMLTFDDLSSMTGSEIFIGGRMGGR